MQQATLSELPSAALHRFPGAPRPGIDIDIYEKDGLQYVSSSSRASKGASFLLINDVSDVAGRSFHAAFKGQCHITKPSMQLAAGFSMASGAPLRWPPPRRGVPRRDQALGKVIGLHYSLIPLVDMLLEKYTAEVERVKVSVCEMSAAAAGSESAAAHDDPGLVLTEDWLEPSDGLMVWVAYALRELSKAPGEPPSIQTTAWLLLASICAADMTFDELLSEPDLAAWALAAMERYEPPEGDPLAESDCWHVELQLRQALTAADPSCPVKELASHRTLDSCT
ncbi:hypothetical protein Agub_g9483 [Astrephomene gubernaculifera]|uniref:Uncharacterized protein n=1 Tax=Astrephomene gubernaculifera TaxID=47775 RepID=A0AAD3DTE3_9CHLO|nr:hypothetical protein Agub_g9483 [Astrephomene gubernaculifera]